MTTEGLKPCPFCGSCGQVWPWHSPNDNSFGVGCNNDGCVHEPWMAWATKEEGISAWNTRASDELIDKLVEALNRLATEEFAAVGFRMDVAKQALALADKWRKG